MSKAQAGTRGVTNPPNRELATGVAVRTAAPVLSSTRTGSAQLGNGQAYQLSHVEIGAIWVARILGSLPLAVILLLLFAAVLAVGTIVESWYSGQAAQELVYQTWWFTLLLGLLGANIFFAAAKKFPWKRHQVGFLITHLGLLAMVAGGVLNSLGGTDSLMVLVDSDRPEVRAYGARATNLMMDKDTAIIRVAGPKMGQEEPQSFDFSPGPLVWRSDPYIEARGDALLTILDTLAYPLPRSWEADLGKGAHLEVLAYYPHARQEKVRPPTAEARSSHPLVTSGSSTGRAGNLPERQVRFVPENCRPGLERQDLTPAIRCLLTVGSEAKEFWVGKTTQGMTPVTVGQETYRVGYNVKTKKLDFAIRLARAEQPVDPGTQQAAGYTSYVQVTDPKRHMQGEDRLITMNEPLNHAGYKLYQTGYEPLGNDPDTGKPISRSVLTVSRDPGLWLKYLGSTMLALGMACMFYMRAYFFQPRGRRLPAVSTSPGELS